MSAPEHQSESVESKPSVKLIRNASGSTQVEVKAYAADVTTAQAEAQRVYDDLCRAYPAPAPKGAR